MSVHTDNAEMIEDAMAYVLKLGDAFAALGVEARFDVTYEGFGTGGMYGIYAGSAVKYLTALASAQGQHARYRTRIRNITVSVRRAEKHFTA